MHTQIMDPLQKINNISASGGHPTILLASGDGVERVPCPALALVARGRPDTPLTAEACTATLPPAGGGPRGFPTEGRKGMVVWWCSVVGGDGRETGRGGDCKVSGGRK
jgi:hypothetical protein